MGELKKHTLEEVRDIIECEGLGYAIQSYTSADRMPTPELAELWKTARDAMDKIEELVGSGDDDD